MNFRSPKFRFPLALIACVLAATALPARAEDQAEKRVDFGREVLPILAQNCYHCHGPDANERQADLRLDTQAGSRQELGGYAALVPGKPDESELVRRIESDDAGEQMPPPDSKLHLTETQRQVLRRWISQGGDYAQHWAFAPPQKADAQGIDELVDARLERESLKRSPRASSEVLCRRLYLDLTGLPPSPREIDAFVGVAQFDQDAAVAELIDRLLDSSAYSEKWARHWLDAARYADSNGFEKDMPREQWAWRDWVLKAIASDMPYDQFVIEQMAGDLIPDHTQDQLVATGFLRNGMVNEEGAIIYEQFRTEGIFDRMDCVGKAVLGLTLQCAQCHTHKFDPLTHDEYFGIFAFLNDTAEAQSWVYTPAQLKQRDSLRNQIAAIEAEIKTAEPDWQEQLNRWIQAQKQSESQWETLDPIEHEWEGGLNHPVKLPDHSVLVLGHPSPSGKGFITAKPKMHRISAIRIEGLRYGDLPFGGPGRSYHGAFAISEVEVFSRQPGSQEWKLLPLGTPSADFAEKDHLLEPFFLNRRGGKTQEERRVGPAAFLVDGDLKTAWRSDRGPVLRETESVALVRLKNPLYLSTGGEIKVRLSQDHGGDGGIDNQQLGRFRIGVTGATQPALPAHDHAATLALETADEAVLFRAWRQSVKAFAEQNQQIAALEAQYPEAATSVLHLARTKPDHHRTTQLLDRGAWDQPKHEVSPHTPAILPPLEAESPTRLDFARWLVDKQNPLAARVQVNRVWQAMFGSGLVETSEDFGVRAPRPEHLAVLDWLAVDFMEHGWSQKHLIRRIATSETYQQTSRVTPELLERDPNNRLLARGARFRVEAEVVRDLALSMAGILHRQVGGPSFFPPVPQSLLDYNFFKPDYWEPAEAPERYRRSLYVFRKRSMPDPVLTTFDAPNSDAACARRTRSNTPLAALVSLNEPVFVEASQAMSLRVLREGGSTDAERIDYAYRLATGRNAKPAEQEALLQLLASQRQRLADGWLSIDKIGFRDPDHRPELPEGVTPQDVAAWAIASRVMLNLDETLTRN
ncbi:PSD1 and planctomycete cytochrome C domain-containing protein [Lignipirellula cremea]|uniref:Planctomycete cytochrome C n=1 Tax=Lignipirellula cremea TaxID=2528010 RepID=A0A518DM28_9BACT|nr:PSD1 and planctomycete cytochrome C domain-containing protein [Lignipirellula cremea]QDU92898.1 Planctomycete cytochrome C [Lignipirellula cremea]